MPNILRKTYQFKLHVKMTNMTPVIPQISTFQAEKSCQEGFNELRRLYSRPFVNPPNVQYNIRWLGERVEFPQVYLEY
jgi:hypothetical protein